MESLWDVRQEFEKLKNNVTHLNAKLQATGRTVLNVQEELATMRKILRNIDEVQMVIDQSKVCINLLIK